MLNSFYEGQLAVLAGYAFCAMLLEHYISKQHVRKNEDGGDDPLLGRKATIDGDRAARALSRKYLAVYAVVMGASAIAARLYLLNLTCSSCRLVAGPVRLFVVQRPVWLL